MLKFATLLFSASMLIYAADPFAGTWKLNASKSTAKAGSLPKDQLVTISESGGNLDTNVTSTPATGSAVSYHYTVPAKGGIGDVSLQRGESSPGGFDAVTSKRPNDATRDLRFTRNGQEVRTVHSVVSSDGKTMHVTVKGKDAFGNPVNVVMVMEKQ